MTNTVIPEGIMAQRNIYPSTRSRGEAKIMGLFIAESVAAAE
jgi:hypothetical protein